MSFPEILQLKNLWSHPERPSTNIKNQKKEDKENPIALTQKRNVPIPALPPHPRISNRVFRSTLQR